MSLPTLESANNPIHAFLNRFDIFDAALVKHANPDVYLPLSDKIALFAIYARRTE